MASSQSCSSPPSPPPKTDVTNPPSTTTELTSTWSASLASTFGLNPSSQFFEYALRALFFGLNLVFNAIMWGLFTRALTLASSTVRVSIINTSANFMITAVMSALVFEEKLPGLWWLGAAMLVAGSVIVGMREEGETGEEERGAGEEGDGPLLDAQGEANDGEGRHELDSVRRRSSSSSERSDEDGTLR